MKLSQQCKLLPALYLRKSDGKQFNIRTDIKSMKDNSW